MRKKKKIKQWTHSQTQLLKAMKITLILICWVMVLIHLSVQVSPQLINWDQKGITFTNGKYCPYVKFNTSKSDLSLYNLRSTGANYVAIIVTHFQTNLNTTSIYATNVTATDQELIHAIEYAHSIGLKIMLKPHIDLESDPAYWRGDIGTGYSEEQWNEWFGNYTQMLVHYAEMAEQYQIEQFSLGCELIATSYRDQQWREVASAVRSVYQFGNITYAANHGGEETNKTWWDVVDYIGVDAYYPLCPDIENATVYDMVDYWHTIQFKGVDNGEEQMTTSLYNLTVFWNKPMIFTELGFCSGQCTKGPGVDLGFQDVHFESVFLAFKDLDWFHGVHWWNWDSDPAFGGNDNWCMTPQFKPTEMLLREQYGGTYNSIVPDYDPVCPCIL